MSKDSVLQTAHVVASIAHDLRSPLNAVLGFSRVLLKGIDGPLSDQQTADLEATPEEVTRGARSHDLMGCVRTRPVEVCSYGLYKGRARGLRVHAQDYELLMA